MRDDAWNSLLEQVLPKLGWLTSDDQSRSRWYALGHSLLSDVLSALQCEECVEPRYAAARRELCQAIETALVHGFLLRTCMPHVQPRVACDWLGGRLIWMHAGWLSRTREWTSLVSSRLGRNGQRLVMWPHLLQCAARTVHSSRQVILTVPGTTLAPLVEPLLAASAVEFVRVRFADDDATRNARSGASPRGAPATFSGMHTGAGPVASVQRIAQWLATRLRDLDHRATCERTVRNLVQVSPAVWPALDSLAELPLEDRVSICWGQSVRALEIRPSGTIAALLERRLADAAFPAGTVSFLIAPTWLPARSAVELRRRAEQRDLWFDRGGVGWYPSGARTATARPMGWRALGECRAAGTVPLVQWTGSYRLCFSSASAIDRRRYLVHCVRGAQGRLAPQSATDLVANAWASGQLPDQSSLGTLLSILRSGRLRSRGGLTRGAQRCVSFSAVPVDQLVSRRAFQSHLGRWDWEPFGLMIDRTALERLGARPVIYGDAATYDALSAHDRPFFQPARRRPGRDQRRHWQQEHEWRLLGDLRLSDLPPAAITIFVAYPHQAQALALTSNWPVIWLQDARIPARPVHRARRPRRAARTGRN